MIVNSYRNNYMEIIGNTLRFSLSLVLLFNGLHLDDHNHSDFDGYSICKPNCSDINHHSLTHDCEKCLKSKNQKKLINLSNYNNYVKSKSAIYINNIFIHHRYIIYSTFFSRPPPTKTV